MSKKDSKSKKHTPTVLELIKKAGKLDYSTDQTVNIVLSYYPDSNKTLLTKQLSTPDTEESNAYIAGKNIQQFELEDAIYDAAISGDIDSQTTFLQLQKEREISKAIEENFFSKTDTE